MLSAPSKPSPRPITELFRRVSRRDNGDPFLRPGDLDWRTPSEPGARARVQRAELAILKAWQREPQPFSLWGDRKGRPGQIELIDDTVPPELRQRPYVSLSPFDHGVLQFWQYPTLEGSAVFLWFRLHYAALEPVIASPSTPEVAAPDKPRSRQEMTQLKKDVVRQIFNEGKRPGTPGYPDQTFIEETARRCGVPVINHVVTARGFDRRTLRRLFDALKSQTS